MTLAQLRYLVAVDTCRNFRKAAEACGVAQPSLSNQLHKLEQSLGVRLVDRSTKPVTPTAIGERVIAQARVVLAEAARIEVLVGHNTADAGPVRVGLTPSLAAYLVPRLVPRLAGEHPDLQVIVEEVAAADLVARLQRDALDVGLVEASVAARGITTLPLFEEPLVLYAAADHPLHAHPRLTAAGLNEGNAWLPAEGALRARILDVLPKGTEQKTPDVRFSTPNLETIKRLVEQGSGWTLLPRLAAEPPAAYEPTCVRPLDPAPTRMVYAVHALAPLKPERINVFLGVVRQEMNGVATEELATEELATEELATEELATDEKRNK